MGKNENKWMTPDELSKYLGLTVKAVYNRVHLQRIPYTKLGASLRFDREAIDEWMKRNSVEPAA